MAKVLLVDDEEADLELMGTILRAEGHEVIVATTGEEALKAFLRASIDVVVTDLQMPHGDGIELISALRGLDPDVAIVAVSGQRRHKLQFAEIAGARAMLSKPVTKSALNEAVARACEPPEADPASA